MVAASARKVRGWICAMLGPCGGVAASAASSGIGAISGANERSELVEVAHPANSNPRGTVRRQATNFNVVLGMALTTGSSWRRMLDSGPVDSTFAGQRAAAYAAGNRSSHVRSLH